MILESVASLKYSLKRLFWDQLFLYKLRKTYLNSFISYCEKLMSEEHLIKDNLEESKPLILSQLHEIITNTEMIRACTKWYN